MFIPHLEECVLDRCLTLVGESEICIYRFGQFFLFELVFVVKLGSSPNFNIHIDDSIR